MHLESKINEALDSISEHMIGSVNSASHRDLVQNAFRGFGVKVKVNTDDAVSKDKDMIIVTGEYSPWKVRQSIEVLLNYAPGGRRIKITKKIWKTLRFDLSQVLQHELIHRRQCSHIEVPSEDWAEHSCKIYASKTNIPAKKIAQEYFGSTEEIEAHAHCIMMELREWAPRTNPFDILRHPKRLRHNQSPTLKDYLETFDYDMRHPVLKRLFTKIVYWIEYI